MQRAQKRRIRPFPLGGLGSGREVEGPSFLALFALWHKSARPQRYGQQQAGGTKPGGQFCLAG